MNSGDLKIEKYKTLSGYTEFIDDIKFSSKGYFASVSRDGKIRLYNSNFSLIKTVIGCGKIPYSLSFNQKGDKLAVGYQDVACVEVRNGVNLDLLYKPDMGNERKNGAFRTVSFSADDKYLYGTGIKYRWFGQQTFYMVREWKEEGKGEFTEFRQTENYITDMKPWLNQPSDNGRAELFYVSSKPTVGRTQPPLNSSKNSITTWYHQIEKINGIISNQSYLLTNNTGDRVTYKAWDSDLVEFSFKERKIINHGSISKLDNMYSFKTKNENIQIKYNRYKELGDKNVKLNGDTLTNWGNKACRSVDVADNGKFAVLGSNSRLDFYDENNNVFSSKYTGKSVWETNITGNGEIVITLEQSGLINWYKTNLPFKIKIMKIYSGSIAEEYGLKVGDIILKVDGKEFYSYKSFSEYVSAQKKYLFEINRNGKILTIEVNKTEPKFGLTWKYNHPQLILSLYMTPDYKDWILYTPNGYFDCSPGAEKYIGWHVNQGDDKEAKFYPLGQFYEKYYTPNLGSRVLAGETFGEGEKEDIKLPPLVKITSPDDKTRINKKELTVNVKVTDQGGGIDEVRLFLNGKLVETTQRGFVKVEQNGNEKTKTFTIQLVEGDNYIKATAFNTQRTEALPDEIYIFHEGVKKTSNLHMLVIGIDGYKNPQLKLNYALADATAFKKEIEEGSKDIFGTINTTFITDAEATRTRIMQEFENIKKTAKQEDVFVFYYAGHGAMSEEEKSQFYIIPYDVTQVYGNNEMLKTKAISAEELQQFSTELKAQKQLFVLDACQSDGMTEMLASRGAAEQKAIAQLARSTGTFWLTASGSEQFATEFAEIGHGVFTYAVLLALQGQADGGAKDNKITVKEISAFLNDKVPELSEKYKGQAQYPTSYGFGQDFPLIIVK